MSRMNRRVDLAAISRRDVLDRRGEPLGRIRELYIDMQEGRVEYATLRLQTDPPAHGRQLVIPWSQFGISENGEHLELAISRAVLENVAARHGKMPPNRP